MNFEFLASFLSSAVSRSCICCSTCSSNADDSIVRKSVSDCPGTRRCLSAIFKSSFRLLFNSFIISNVASCNTVYNNYLFNFETSKSNAFRVLGNVRISEIRNCLHFSLYSCNFFMVCSGRKKARTCYSQHRSIYGFLAFLRQRNPSMYAFDGFL